MLMLEEPRSLDEVLFTISERCQSFRDARDPVRHDRGASVCVVMPSPMAELPFKLPLGFSMRVPSHDRLLAWEPHRVHFIA